MNLFRLALTIGAGIITANLVRSKIQEEENKLLEGKTFVVIGASSGIGKGVAIKLGKYRANVVLAARRTELLREVASEVRQAGGQALIVTTDISNYDDIRNLAAAARDEYGSIDVWINDTGVGMIGRFWETPVEDQERLIDVNFKGILFGTYTALNIFVEQGYGAVINVGSSDSEVPMAFHAAYSATKAAVRSIGQSINQELRLSGLSDIRIVTIEPWGVDTPWWRHAANYSGGTPRMAAIDQPGKVVKAIIAAAHRGRGEVTVGWKSSLSQISHRLFPRFTREWSANLNYNYQYATAPPAEDTSGSLHRPMDAGTGVSDGVRARIKEEKNLYKE